MKWKFHGDDEAGLMAAQRQRMVENQLRARGIADETVLSAMNRVPRHEFLPDSLQDIAYADGPLPIGKGQTISQPYVVAAMSEALDVQPGMRVLEIGTGSGYQAAILAEMGLQVYTVEFIPELAQEAQSLLNAMGYTSIHFRCGDGNYGWEEEAPFDGIIVTAAPPEVPPAFAEQLSPGCNLVIPVGRYEQDLRVYHKNEDGSLSSWSLFGVRFVPLVGG
ncbi:MAG TPA: protein-L-isoaspartate(D-aspartate) O-methyltransferase [Oceanipulchritudo sp.]|nr:protein-L-isoaspartate(D-aspartate) O-methyltransferase [Oceanipulchritudo sp.]